MKKKPTGPQFLQRHPCLIWNTSLIFTLGFEWRIERRRTWATSFNLASQPNLPSPAQTLGLRREVKACTHLRTTGSASWSPVILSGSHFPSFLKNQACQPQQTAFKNIVLAYAALPSTFLTMPIYVPSRTGKGVEYLFFFSSFSLTINTLVWVERLQTPAVWSHLRAGPHHSAGLPGPGHSCQAVYVSQKYIELILLRESKAKSKYNNHNKC